MLNDPFGEQVEAFIKSQDITMSGILAAQAELVSGYIPIQEKIYDSSVLLTGSGSWTVPAGITRLHVVLISGGQGGPGGYSGEDGGRGTGESTEYSYIMNVGPAGEGGKGASTGGSGGLVYEVDVEVTTGQAFTYSCGAGGAGGSSGSLGSMGTPSTLGEYTSEKGNSRPGGVTDLFSGKVYALPNTTPGRKGGRGTGSQGTGETITYNGQSWVPGKKPEHESGYASSAGYGGGAAIGSNGGDGKEHVGRYTTGDGGRGATPITPPASTAIGGGGAGGHGGGGGGGAGSYSIDKRVDPDAVLKSGDGGIGGSGGRGGTGGPGGIIVYW